MDVITLAMAKGYADKKMETAKAYTDEKLAEVGGNGGGQNGNTNNQSGAGIPHIELKTNPFEELPTDFCSFLDEQLEKRQPFSCTFTLAEDENTTMIYGGFFMFGLMLYEGEAQMEAFMLRPGDGSTFAFMKTDGVWAFTLDHGE